MYNTPAKVAHMGSSTILGLFLCSNCFYVVSCNVLDGLNFTSDPFLITLKVSTEIYTIPDIIVFCGNFPNVDTEAFVRDMHSADFHSIFYINDLNLKLNMFNKLLIDRHAPVKQVKFRKNKGLRLYKPN